MKPPASAAIIAALLRRAYGEPAGARVFVFGRGVGSAGASPGSAYAAPTALIATHYSPLTIRYSPCAPSRIGIHPRLELRALVRNRPHGADVVDARDRIDQIVLRREREEQSFGDELA